MRTTLALIIGCLLTFAGGCGSSIHDTKGEGPLSSGLYHDAQLENQQRLAGEDHRIKPLYLSPMQAIGVGYDKAIGDPFSRLWDYMTKNTEGVAAREMIDFNSPDKRIAGTLRLVDFANARTGPYIIVYADKIARDPDYTVAAAGLRALNRCRAKGYTALFLSKLDDNEVLVRLEAADALGNIPDVAAIPALENHLQVDVSVDVRISCADALRNYKTIEVAKILVNQLDDKNFGVAWQSRQSLALITGQDFRYDQNAWLTYLSQAKDLQ
jgi:hypothetical protein